MIGAGWPTVAMPLVTFVIKVCGAFVIGLLATLFRIDFATRYGDILTAGVLTGFRGGHTTFSSTQLDAATLARRAGQGQAAFCLLASVVAGGWRRRSGLSSVGFWYRHDQGSHPGCSWWCSGRAGA